MDSGDSSGGGQAPAAAGQAGGSDVQAKDRGKMTR